MVTRKLILWTNVINILCAIGGLIIIALWSMHILVNIKYLLIPTGLFAIVALIAVINSLFALDNKVFLNDYDSMRATLADAKTHLQTIAQYEAIIGKHEAVKLWSLAKTDFSKLVTKVKDEAIKVGTDVKEEVNKVEAPVKEIFEEKAINNIPITPTTNVQETIDPNNKIPNS